MRKVHPDYDWPASELKAWREGMGYSTREAPAAIGCGRTAYINWEQGVYPVPQYIAMACNLIAQDQRGPRYFLPAQVDLEDYLEESEA